MSIKLDVQCNKFKKEGVSSRKIGAHSKQMHCMWEYLTAQCQFSVCGLIKVLAKGRSMLLDIYSTRFRIFTHITGS